MIALVVVLGVVGVAVALTFRMQGKGEQPVKKVQAITLLAISGALGIGVAGFSLGLFGRSVRSIDWQVVSTDGADTTPTSTPDTRPTFPQGTQCVSTCPTTPAPTPVVTAAPTLPPSVATTSPVPDVAVVPYLDANGDKAVRFAVCHGPDKAPVSIWHAAGFVVYCDTDSPTI